MKSTIVPAQVTTVEDRVAGSLTLSQLLLLITPVLTASILYVFLPPFFGYKNYKIALIVLISFVFIILALRIRGRLVAQWLAVIGKYNMRPKAYVYDKNSNFCRAEVKEEPVANTAKVKAKEFSHDSPKKVAIDKIHSVEDLIKHPQRQFSIRANKEGGFSVYLNEVET